MKASVSAVAQFSGDVGDSTVIVEHVQIAQDDDGASLLGPLDDGSVLVTVIEVTLRWCRAERWGGTPSPAGPHEPHFFTYGKNGDEYKGSCSGATEPERIDISRTLHVSMAEARLIAQGIAAVVR